MSSLDLTREWLITVLRPYPARERLISEVIDVLGSRRTLSVKTDAFTYNTGQTALLLLLHGTLPIQYRGATYQIPLHIWVPHEYPRKAPLAFVVPTKEMGVRKGREVEPDGQVREEVIEGWWRSWEPKTIEALLRQLTSIFSATPPVYARPPEGAGTPGPGQRTVSAQQTGSNGYPHSQGIAGPSTQPPPPPARPSYQPQAAPGPTPASPDYLPQYHSAPTPPPHPYAHQPNPSLQQQIHTRQTSASYPNQPGHAPFPPNSPSAAAAQPPTPHRPQVGIPPRQGSLPPGSPGGASPAVPQRPYPPMQHQAGDGQAGTPPRSGPGPGPGQGPGAAGMEYAPGLYQPSLADGQFGSPPPMSSSGSTSYQPMFGPPPTQQPPIHPSQRPGPPVPYPPNGSGQPYHPGAGYAASPPQSRPYQSHQHTQHSPGASGAQKLQQIARSATINARPPIAELRPAPPPDLLSAADNDSDLGPSAAVASASGPPPIPPSKPPPPSLLHLHSILLPHLAASLPPLLTSLSSSRAHLLERREDLHSGEPAIRDEMARLDAVRKVCESTGKKLGEVVSLDNAIDDTIYHITRAFESERIDLDRFLKSIRSLAREQYMKRALIERILQGMGQKQGW